jgi:hypothetical protein
MGFELRIYSYSSRCLDLTTTEAIEHMVVIFGQYKILKSLLDNSSYRGGWKNKLEKMWTCRVPLNCRSCAYISYMRNTFHLDGPMLVELNEDELITMLNSEHFPFELVIPISICQNVKQMIHSLVMCLPSRWWHFNHTGSHHCQWKAANIDLCCTHSTSARILTCQHLQWHDTSVFHLKTKTKTKPRFLYLTTCKTSNMLIVLPP